MKLTIIPLVNPTEQQYADLYKIWTDQNQSQLTEALESGQYFYAARFNDRLLAAAKITLNKHHGVIYDFCVREVTRRRGVGLYLLQQICYQQPKITHWHFSFSELDTKNEMVMTQFLAASGFTATEKQGEWEMNLNGKNETK
ncbi:aspartate 1-decarboxylase autocleavage activator PanM [Providencia heimbachae]|uniref:PanD regulatory factor n=1 Tax=Providencia heimbachae ATCC 35613 TaxID=1354272 RepID=A0A1B7JYH8_9GAMM|nr:aspartate 1-decarboxylase autocleavage activator PanM [Providencia heimbachae]OAT52794.1 putative acetyltransferase [Providencia heimbachae ATCC 35613]SQH14712.1 Acetyltransferase, GNAT family [Providencia heimbachae]